MSTSRPAKPCIDKLSKCERDAIEELRCHAWNAPIPKMLTTTENTILSFSPIRLRKKYPSIVKEYMAEVHSEFDRLIKIFSYQKVLVPAAGDYIPERDHFRFKRLGKTPRYNVYLKNRERIKKILMSPYPFMRAIVHYAHKDFPKVLIDYSKYRQRGEISIYDLKELITDDLRDNKKFLKKEWYPKILKIMFKYYRKQMPPRHTWRHVISCAAALINLQINDLKMRSIDYLNEVLLNPYEIPFLGVRAICDRNYDLLPTLQEIFDIFHNFNEAVLLVGKSLPSIEFGIDPEKFPAKREFFKIGIGESYPAEAHDRLQATLEKAYAPVLEHLANFRNTFQYLYSMEGQKRLTEYLEIPHTFDEYLNEIELISVGIDKLRSVVLRQYFEYCVIHQREAIISIKAYADGLVAQVAQIILKNHLKENKDICNEFSVIKHNALTIPKTTETLMNNGAYMLNIQKVVMENLRFRIQEMLRIGGALIELTVFPKENLDGIIAALVWYKDMPKIIELNSYYFELYKSQFEDKLKNVRDTLNDRLEEMHPELSVINDMIQPEQFREYRALLHKYIDKLKYYDDTVAWINKEEVLFKMPKSSYIVLTVMKNFVHPFYALIVTCIKWLRYYNVWMYGPFEYLEPKFVEETADEYLKEFQKHQKFFRNKIKLDAIDNSLLQFRGKVEDPDQHKQPSAIQLAARGIFLVRDFRLGVQMVSIMCNSSLRDRHWEEMSSLAGFDLKPDAGTTLAKIIGFNLHTDIEKYEIVSIGANKELQLQNNLADMQKEWSTILFNLSQYKDTDITILSSMEDIQALLDDHIIKALSMRGSAFVKPCEEEVKLWYAKLIRINATLEEWGKVQSNWLYLLPIFSSKDIVAQMPEEGRLFVSVDQTFRRYMQMIIREPRVIESAPVPGLLEALEGCTVMLDDITTGVNNYLEKKRLYFPRFFFLSNDEMLEILSETKDPLRVQPHLSKCFEGIYRLDFDYKLDIHSMYSIEKENVMFVNTISTSAARGSVEIWLLRVEEEMLNCVKHRIDESYYDYRNKPRTEWVLIWPGMIVLCVSQIYWGAEIHECFAQSDPLQAIYDYHEKLKVDLNEIVALIRSKHISNIARISVKALIVIDVHAKDVVAEFVHAKVRGENDFNWQSQLRYYWQEDNVQVKIVSACVPFANEYLGNSDRLVITPLTDRCYRTLMGAYQLHLNGAPEGPAGTGKTETTKDLAKALAVQCKVFNCSDGLDYKAMGKFFKGLASSGAWACFDEFNRIELEVLSVVAQQILCIVVAVRANMFKFNFEGTLLILNPACYVCITMNPGYAGRSELPDNLKVLFRTVAMMVPDYAMIGEISLYSFGFVDARALAVKIVTTYRLCSEQLSSQNHYDYGMRAVKTVLQACGNLKKQYPDDIEEILLLRSLVDVNLPKFLSFDVPLFEGIISDLFPGVTLPKPDYTLLTNAFEEVCLEWNLQPKDCFLLKVIQTFEMIIVRHGFMLVGEPFAGKSVTLKVLAECLGRLKPTNANPYFQKVKYGVVNPKSITMGQLYGAFDPISYEWTDGISSTIFRTFTQDVSDDRKWLIFDGPVDAVWIENMNTVLDDNKKLCLTSGEVITMSNSMSMIFEVMDLSQASPATVSRCGMIYMEPVTLGWEPFTLSWLNKCNPKWSIEYYDMIMDMMRWVIPDCLTFVKRFCKQLLYPGDINLVLTTLNIFEMQIDDGVANNEDYGKHLMLWFQAALLFAVVWGIGGILDTESRKKFDVFYKEFWTGNDPDHPTPQSMGKIEISIPSESLFFDFVYIYKQKGTWKSWPDIVRKQEIETGVAIQIPTIDTARYLYILDMFIRYKKKLLLVGPTGTGKSFYIQNFMMSKLPAENYLPIFITFTTMITAFQTQDLILSKLTKRKGFFGPPKGKHCVLFIDDMNMPVKEVYGAQPPIELIRQYFDQGHWYDFKDTSKIILKDILVISACGLVGGSRQDVYSRFLAHFNVFAINNFSEETMEKIFSAVLIERFHKTGHAADVLSPVHQIVHATIDIYRYVCSELRPTPTKSHYVFNLRDVSRVIAGCSLLRKESVENKKIFAKLWFHEVMRVFFDRLIDDSDHQFVYGKLEKNVVDFFRDKMDSIFEDFLDANGKVSRENMSDLMFASYFDMDSDLEDRRYEQIANIETLRKLATFNLNEFNATHKIKMDVVLFRYAVQHLNRIGRIMSMPAGSCLLVGMSGSGRQSLTKLASYMCAQTMFQPEITKNYGPNEWREDLKKVLREAGGLGKDTVFLFTEGQMKMELFLQDIDCLLNLGEVPNIFPIDEKQDVLEMVRLAAQGGNRNLDVSPLQVFQFFINRCKIKLHVVLCFSPIGSSFRTRTRLYPSLVNCCTIDWFESWPEDALEKVAERYMAQLSVPDAVKAAAVMTCKHFHVVARETSDNFYMKTGRKTYVTSASYLEIIKSFRNLITIKQDEIMLNKNRYIGGLNLLEAAATDVGVMQKELNLKQPELKVLAANTIKMAKEIEKESEEAAIATEQVKRDEIAANIQAAESTALKEECEKDLALAIPILEDAISSLNTLKPADITIVKSMKTPPNVVKLVMAAVCVMKGIAPDRVNDPSTGKKILDYWGPSKKMLGDMYFLQSLKDYDKDNINPDIMAKVRKEYLPDKDFQPAIIAKASSAAEGLCKWIIAMDKYDEVAKIVGPKKAKFEEAMATFEKTMQLLNEKRAMAARLAERVAELNAALRLKNKERQQAEDDVELCIQKLFRAEKLIGGLGGERTRWTDSANNLQKAYDGLAGDILISCGIIAYLAPLTSGFRSDVVLNWHEYCKKMKIPCSEKYSLTTILGSEVKIQNWNIYGLPQDSFSTENAIIMDNSSRYSLFIDPQTQANKWIKNMEKKNNLKAVKFSQSDYMKKIETCLELGYPVVIENVEEELEAPLDPLLAKNTFRQGGVNYISLGDNVIAFSPKFRLYITSNLRNPHYLPEVFNKVTIINFALTIEGLEDQLLGIVVAKERPDLQELRQELIVQNAKNKGMLEQVEEMILKTLNDAGNKILEDESAIQILDDSKILSDDIQVKQIEAKKTEIEIDIFRQSYRPVAAHCSTLYYCITELPNIDPMYQFSLAWYINLYVYSIESANKSRELQKRLRYLMEAVTFNLYNNVCRSLFEKDKLLFSFILTTKIMLAYNKIEMIQFMFLLTGGTQTSSSPKNPDSGWITEKIWEDVCRLEQIKEFAGFIDSFAKKNHEWQKYYDVADPHLQKLPEPWENKTTSFEKLLILHAIRPDKIAAAISQFVANEMGSQFIQPPPFDIAKSFEDANSLTPLVFILSPGADPMLSLLLFGEKLGFSESFESISLGQGQGPIAEALISKAQTLGTWVCLQNCHLAASWMPRLEFLWENMDYNNTAHTFRLWLTSYPSDKFPPAILQNGIKMTNEPPTGLQQNLLRSYNSEPMNDDSFYGGCIERDKPFTKLLFGICFFHAVVQERRKFGPLGWNISYGFNESDFQISVKQLQMFLNDYETIPYVAIAYLCGECNYGGRVTDAWDRRAIVTILDDYVNENVVEKPGHVFFRNEEQQLTIPIKLEHRAVCKFIEENIPVMPSPDVYGLHPNAGITRDLSTSNLLLESIILTQGAVSSGGDADAEKNLLATVKDIENRLPKDYDLDIAKEKYPVDYNESMNTVLVQEMERFNKLLIEIRNTCKELQNAVIGIIVLTPELEDAANYITYKKIPLRWMKKSYPSLKQVGSYVNDFLRRLVFLQKWYDNGKPSTFWLSGFYFTQAFLTGAMQNYARKYRIPIDTLTFDFNVLKVRRTPETPENGVYVDGLFIEGAKWNIKSCILEEQLPKVLIDIMPVIHLIPTLFVELNEGNRYKCPIYKTAERKGILSTTGHSTNYVLPILIGTRIPVSHWVKRSVALLCQTTD